MEDLSDEIYKVLVASGVHVSRAADISHKFKERARLKADKQSVELSLDELIAEHRRLLNVLNNGDPETLRKEAEDQSKELQDYINKKEASKPFKVGDTVKVMSSSFGHTGKVGIISSVGNNGAEDFYDVKFHDGQDVLFAENLKKIRDSEYSLSRQLMKESVETPSEEPVVKAEVDEVSEYFAKVRKHLVKQIEREE
jgi:hypothetical protein